MASEERAEIILPLIAGLTDKEQISALALSDGSYNLYPDLNNEPYLTNYPGKEDVFLREGDLPSYVSTPPSTSTKITRTIAYRDQYGNTHIVFVQGQNVCYKIGNGFRVLHTLYGQNYDGRFFPDLVVHEGLLIILNYGDTPVVWDGQNGVDPVGVQEAPLPPNAWGQTLPGAVKSSGNAGSYMEEQAVFPMGRIPDSFPAFQKDSDGADIDGFYSVCIQYVDKYGNKSRPSPGSEVVHIVHKTDASGSSPDYKMYLRSRWLPPMVDEHIVGVIIGRTQNLNRSAEVGPTGYKTFYQEYVYDHVTCTRFTHQVPDSQLLDNGLIDNGVYPPPSASIGLSWNGRMFYSGMSNPVEVAWSDAGLFGQTRQENRYFAKDHVKALRSIGDRVLVITRTTVEVLYDNNGIIGTLEIHDRIGSSYGRSFVDVSNLCFGLWNESFGFFDGVQFTPVETPYYIRSIYMDQNHNVYAARLHNDLYAVSIKKDSQAGDNNYILLYHMRWKQWYLVKDTVFDITVFRDQWIGCDDSIYELFRGDYSAEAVMNIEGFIPPGDAPQFTRVLSNFRVLMQPSSNLEMDISVFGDLWSAEATESKAAMLPSPQAMGRHKYFQAFWNKAGALYSDNNLFVAPRDVWIEPQMKKQQTGHTHDVKVTFPAGHRLMLKALGMSFSPQRRK